MSTADTETEEARDPLSTLRIPRRDAPRGPTFWGRVVRYGLILGVIAAIGIGFVLARKQHWLGGMANLLPDAIRSLPEVRVARVKVERGRSADALVVATGYLESQRQAKIGARAAGRIESISVEEGSRVERGQVLAVLEHKDMDAALDAAEATLAQAKAQLAEQDVEISLASNSFARAEKLRASRSITEVEYDQAKFSYEGAKARRITLAAAVDLAQARVRQSTELMENMIIRAPFDGTVISKDAEVGESILPGGMGEASGRGSVVTIADLEHLEVDTDVKEDYIGRVLAGTPAEVEVDAVPEQRFPARVRKIIPMGDRARATIKVKVEILQHDERLFPEMSSTVYFLPSDGEQPSGSDDRRRVFCDAQSLQSDDSGEHVWLLGKDNRAKRIDVKTGVQQDDRFEITEGLEGGERVILDPPGDIAEGQLLKVRD